VAARNLISGNGTGLFLYFPTGTTTQGNYIGTDVTGSKAVPNGIGIQVLYPRSELIGGTVVGAGNVISGNSGDGINVGDTGSSVVRVTIQGNNIGTDATGTKALGNARGIEIGHHPTQIGGTVAGARNIISGNTGAGVDLPDTLESFVQGNYIGTDVTGTKALGNGIGVSVTGYTHLIGGTAAGDGNLISGNVGAGVVVSGNYNVVQGNRIGTEVTGTMALGNDTGVSVSGSGNTIGGTIAAARNVISGNKNSGIAISGSNNLVQGNYIGTDGGGAKALGNQMGMSISGTNNTVGGTVSGSRNLISGNQQEGIYVTGTGTVIQGNYIGTDVGGTQIVKDNNGVKISGPGTLVGGLEPTVPNLISGNNYGINVKSTGTIIQGNFIGTDVTGSRSLINGVGIQVIGIGTADALIGGTVPGSGNLISGNGIGVYLQTTAGSIVQGNYIGTDVTGTLVLSNNEGVAIYNNATDNLIGGTTAGAGNVISCRQRLFNLVAKRGHAQPDSR
jgi:titin